MKKLLVSLFALAIVVTGFAQETKDTKATDLVSFATVKHDFGKIKQGVPVTYDFVFKNISKDPVVISSATASCGCTTPTWPQKPVPAKKSDKIKAGFNAANLGSFTKTIHVNINGANQPLDLTITGEVLNAEEYEKYESSKKTETTN